MFLVSFCICHCPIHCSQVLSRERRCSWSSADRRCSNYIWVISNFIAYNGATYIRRLTVLLSRLSHRILFYVTLYIKVMSYSISDHWQLNCLFNMFRLTTKKTAQLHITGPCEGNPPVTGGFPLQSASNTTNISMSWHIMCQKYGWRVHNYDLSVTERLFLSGLHHRMELTFLVPLRPSGVGSVRRRASL